MVDVAGDHVDVAPDGHDLEGRPGAASPGRDDLDRLAVAGPLAQEHLVAGEEGDGDRALLGDPGGPGALGAGPHGRAGGAGHQGADEEQDAELAGASRGGHAASSGRLVASERFAPNAP